MRHFDAILPLAAMLASCKCRVTLSRCLSTVHTKKNVDDKFFFPILLSTIPPPFFFPNYLFTSLLTINSSSLSKAKGILLNTFDTLDQETITALKNGKVLSNLPPVFPIGTFEPIELEQAPMFRV
ncbi:hypothetical protein LguiA_006321 [Lonicera macranthoides]